MAKKQWNTTFNEEILRDFQNICESYDMKANTVLEALMRFFSEGNCKLVIDKNGCRIKLETENEIKTMQKQIKEIQERLENT